MAIPTYTGDTDFIAALATYWIDRGLTGPEFQAMFDKFGTEFKAWFNGTFIPSLTAANVGAAAASHTQAETTLTFTDVTTSNSSTDKHGFLPKLGGGASNFLRADGSWALPPGAIYETSYTGNGTYGSGNTTSVTFSSPPKFVIVQDAAYGYVGMWLYNSSIFVCYAGTGAVSNSATLSTNTLTWYNAASAQNQMNSSGVTYYVKAFL